MAPGGNMITMFLRDHENESDRHVATRKLVHELKLAAMVRKKAVEEQIVSGAFQLRRETITFEPSQGNSGTLSVRVAGIYYFQPAIRDGSHVKISPKNNCPLPHGT